jgi:hypothetical protein
MAANADPLAFDSPFDPSLFETPWGPGLFQEYGSWSPQGGTWDDLLKSGPSVALGARWKLADFSGDLLPPSSTYLLANYRYAFMKGDQDAQVVGPAGAATDVLNLRVNMAEFGISQRFMGPSRRGLFVDLGSGVGIGAAHAKTIPALLTPGDTPVLESQAESSALLLRAELRTGIGWQMPRVDARFGTVIGINGTEALSDSFRSQTDIGARLSATLYLWE